MRKNIIYIMMLLLTSVAFVSCDKNTTEGVTRTTTYAVLTLEGSSAMTVKLGEEYVEPGYTAVLGGKDVTSGVKVTSNVDVNTLGVYTVTYSSVNTDGFTSSVTRTIVVADPNYPLEGAYLTTSNSYRTNLSSGANTVYGGNYLVILRGNEDGTYTVDDLLGGYYCYRAGYGTYYQMNGNISIADDGTITLNESSIAGWGDSLDELTDGKYDASTGSMSWAATYVGSYTFYVTINKQ